MSRVAKAPISVPKGVEVKLEGQQISVKGSKGVLALEVNGLVAVQQDGAVLSFAPKENTAAGWAQAGTARALVNNMVVGVSAGFERRLLLTGVGYRAKAAGSTLNLTLGFSHPIDYQLPEGVSAETPSQTEIVLKSSSKQVLGQAAAEIRAFRPPEPYKGKGVRYADETILRKEAKKK